MLRLGGGGGEGVKMCLGEMRGGKKSYTVIRPYTKRL